MDEKVSSGPSGGSGLPSFSATSGCDASEPWVPPLGVVGVFTFIGFVLGCVATDMARTNAADIAKLQKKHSKVCQYGDVLYGEEIHEGGSGTFYQIVGTHGASITWAEALADAKSRCYNGHPGYLAMIGSEAENDFIHSRIQDAPSYAANDNAWIGAVDFTEEGTFGWLGPKKEARGIVFWVGGEDGTAWEDAYSNWADGEPNEGGATGRSEDCVAIYGGGGKWYDNNCYMGLPFFVVEFGPPSINDLWNEQHDDALDDDEVVDAIDDKASAKN